MDRINSLPDDLLVKILSFLPTKIVVSTSILSKRWQFLWMWLTKLEYNYYDGWFGLEEFINKNLPLHRAPIIEILRFQSCGQSDYMKRWIEIAISRHVRELDISDLWDESNIFPSSFYTCESLVNLKFSEITLMNVPSMGCLPSLKTLELKRVHYMDESSLQSLLSLCPVLEDLSMICGKGDVIRKLTIVVPSLQSLSLFLSRGYIYGGYEIDTPSLKYLKLEDWKFRGHYIVVKNMPNLREANISVELFDIKSLIGSTISVKHLTICTSRYVDGDGFVFNQLEHLKLCPCNNGFSNLFGQLLKSSPNLRVLDLAYMENHKEDELSDMRCWNQPSNVPECLLSSLQIFNWSRYFGRPQDRDIAVYILKHACHLKTATVLADSMQHQVPNLKMIKELTLSSRASSTCELKFVEDGHIIN